VSDLRNRLTLIDDLSSSDLPRHLDVLQAIFRRLVTTTWYEWRAAVTGRPSPPRRLQSGDKVYAVKRGRSPGLYYSAPEARAQTTGFGGAIARSFRTVSDATEFMNIPIDPPPNLDRATCHEAYTDGSSVGLGPAARAGWGFLTLPPASDTPSLQQSGPVQLAVSHPDYLGATKYTNNTGELSALAHAFRWALSVPEPPQTLLVYSDSEHALQKAFLPPPPGRPGRNPALVGRTRALYLAALARLPVYLLWTKGHDHTGSRSARWNAVADQLASAGRLAAPPPPIAPTPPCPAGATLALSSSIPPCPAVHVVHCPHDSCNTARAASVPISPLPHPSHSSTTIVAGQIDRPPTTPAPLRPPNLRSFASSPNPPPLTGDAMGAPREGVG
jgi:ribonuclease HI